MASAGTILGAGVAAGAGVAYHTSIGTALGGSAASGSASAVAVAAGHASGIATVNSGAAVPVPYPGGRTTFGTVQLFPFAPGSNAPFTFQPTLDGQVYTAIVKSNVFGQRYYVSLYTLQNVRVFTVAMVASPGNYDISICAGYFTSLMVFREASKTFEILSNPVAVAA